MGARIYIQTAKQEYIKMTMLRRKNSADRIDGAIIVDCFTAAPSTFLSLIHYPQGYNP